MPISSARAGTLGPCPFPWWVEVALRAWISVPDITAGPISRAIRMAGRIAQDGFRVLSAWPPGGGGRRATGRSTQPATGLLQAGVDGVVASRWFVSDARIMVLVSGRFYDFWAPVADGAKKDLGEAREALDSGGAAWLWSIPFLVWTACARWAAPIALVGASFAHVWMIRCCSGVRRSSGIGTRCLPRLAWPGEPGERIAGGRTGIIAREVRYTSRGCRACWTRWFAIKSPMNSFLLAVKVNRSWI